MRESFVAIAALLLVFETGWAEAPPQPNTTQIMPKVSDLGPEWISNRVEVLVDPLCSPKEMTDEKDGSQGWLTFARDLLHKDASRESYAVLRYYYRDAVGNRGEALVWVMRWKSKDGMGSDWGGDPETKNTPDTLPRIGEEVHAYQRHGLHNDISFRRGTYLIIVESPNVYGWEHVKRLAEVLDKSFLTAQASVGAWGRESAK
jgi:hypothetical protein